MKVALIHLEVGFRGGLETRIRNYLKYFLSINADITLFYYKMDTSVEIPKHVKLVNIDVKKIFKPLRIHFFSKKLKKILDPNDYDFSLSMGRTASQFYSIAANTHYGHLVSQNKFFKTPIDYLTINLDHQAYAISKKIYACSQMVKDEIIKYSNVDNKKIEVLFPPLNLSQFNQDLDKTELRETFNLNPEVKYYLFVSTSHKRKGLGLLKKIFKQLNPKKYCLLVAGTSFVSKQENIKSLGFIKDVHLYYRAVDFLIHPAVYEPFGNIVPEAISCGTPVIISKNTGAKEILLNENYGVVINDYKTDTWVNKIKEIADKDFKIEKNLAEINELSIEMHMKKMLFFAKLS